MTDITDAEIEAARQAIAEQACPEPCRTFHSDCTCGNDARRAIAAYRAHLAAHGFEIVKKPPPPPCWCGISDANGPLVCPQHGRWGWQDETGNNHWFTTHGRSASTPPTETKP